MCDALQAADQESAKVPGLTITEAPDLENNVKGFEVFENNNDEATENLEETRRHDGDTPGSNLVKKNVNFAEDTQVLGKNHVNAAHEIIRGRYDPILLRTSKYLTFRHTTETKYHVGDTILTSRPFAFVINASHRSACHQG